MAWTSIHEEQKGVERAVINMDGDPVGLARYLYDRMSSYRGEDHESISRHLLYTAFRALGEKVRTSIHPPTEDRA